jgi:hypothetical protein
VSAIDGAAFFTKNNSVEKKYNKVEGSGRYNEGKIKRKSKVQERIENGPVCMRCEVSCSSSSRPPVDDRVTATVSQNVWGNRRHSVSYLHGRAGSNYQNVTLCAFGMRGKRATKSNDLLLLNNNNNDDDDDYSSSSSSRNTTTNNNIDKEKNKYVPHVQMNMTPIQGSWKVRDVMWGQAIGNDCTMKCYSKGCGSNIGISSSLKIRTTKIQHEIVWRERDPGQDARQYVLSKVSGKMHLVLPKHSMNNYQKSVLGAKVCWSLGNVVDCTFSYTRPKYLKFNVSISKSPEKRAALQFGIQNGDC